MEECKCKYCKDTKLIKTESEIGQSYNYSCYYHKRRADRKYISIKDLHNYLNKSHKSDAHLIIGLGKLINYNGNSDTNKK